MMKNRVLIVPTYNESGNIEKLLNEIVALKIEGLKIIVVDDSSPDGTSDIVKKLSAKHSEIVLLQRKGLRGRGTAGIAGFDLAVKMKADEIIEMDADFSHPPADLIKLFEGLKHADIVVASRLCEGAVDTRPFSRRFITKLANIYARILLQSPKHRSRLLDWTTGYRAYRKSVFENVPPLSLISQGPSIVQELLFRALNSGLTAIEVPFTMIDRAEGKSSFTPKVARQSIMSIPAYRVLFHSSYQPVNTADIALNQLSANHYTLVKANS